MDVLVLSCSVMSNSLQPYELYPARFLCPWGFSRQNTEVGCHAVLLDLPNPGIELRCPAFRADSLPAEPPDTYNR